ncbi:MAG: hypothetical protein WAU38_12685 [Ignavibacteria bacterium]
MNFCLLAKPAAPRGEQLSKQKRYIPKLGRLSENKGITWKSQRL